jgi:hypothetical protein
MVRIEPLSCVKVTYSPFLRASHYLVLRYGVVERADNVASV